MYDQLLNDFLKKESTTKHKSKADSPNYELFQKMDITEELAKNGDLYNGLQKTYTYLYSLYAAENRYDKTIDSWINIAKNILFDHFIVIKAYNKKIYCQSGAHCKKDISAYILDKFNQEMAHAFEKFFDKLYKYIETMENLKDSLMYLWILCDSDLDTYNKLLPSSIPFIVHQELSSSNTPTYCVIHPAKYLTHNTTKPFMLLAISDKITYEVINHKATICYNDDLYELNIDTIKKLFSIKSRHNEILKKYIHCQKEEIERICVSISIKDLQNIRPFFKYLYPNRIQCCLNANNGTVSISSHNTTTAFIKPIILARYSLNLFRNGYVPRILCNCLQVISNNNYSTINKLAKLFADCLLPYPISKKLYVINVKSDRNLEIIKCFINRILSYGNGDDGSVCVIDKNQTINDVCKNYKRLDELKYARIYAMFMERGKKPLDPQLSIYLSYLLKNTSNNSKNTIVNNIQLILFQKTDDISDIPSELVEYIDISDSEPDERICMLSVEDCSWTRLYFSIYGLHLILDKQKSRHKFDLGCKLTAVPTPDDHKSIRRDLIQKITDRFIREYFISKQETEKRKAERAKRIKELKKQHGKSVSAKSIITLELSQFPLYTTRTNLEKYIQKYLETQYKSSFLKEKNITIKDIYNCIQKEYEYTGTNLEYTMTKMYHAFTGLSLKEPWSITKSKMEATNVNNVAEPDTEPIEAPKTATFDDPIDENLLDFLTKLNNAVMF